MPLVQPAEALDEARRRDIEAYFDTAPRERADVEACGPFTIFVSRAPWPFYARPRPDNTAEITVDHVRAVVERQRALGTAVQIEWQHDLAPDLRATATEAGLVATLKPLMVHDPFVRVPLGIDGWNLELVGPEEPDLARIRSAVIVGWRQVDTDTGPAGAAERDALPVDQVALDFVRAELADGRRSMAVARNDHDGPVAVGQHRLRGDVTEIVGIGVLPAFRRRGLAAAVTAMLVDDAYARGARMVMLTAESDAVARIYERIGFRRIGSAGVAEPRDVPWDNGPDDA